VSGVEVETKGLVGGHPEMRLKNRRCSEIEHPYFLDPLDSPAHAEALREFSKSSPLAVEVGFGRGYFLGQFALLNPEWKCLGIEVKRKLIREALSRLENWGVESTRLLLGDARPLLPPFLGKCSVDALFILFPDPWWKKKHHKRRLLSEVGLAPFMPLLKKGALVIVRSDVPLVLDLAREVLPALGCDMIDGPGLELPPTDRERVCDRIGIPSEELCFRFDGEVGP
jgi:tRNA (guanine-N7-)-methyltransferase